MMPMFCWPVVRKVVVAPHAAARSVVHRVFHATHHVGKTSRHWMRHGPLHMSHRGARVLWRVSLVCVMVAPPAIALPPLLASPPTLEYLPPPTYRAADLMPPTGAATPRQRQRHSIPEPGTVAVLAVALAALGIAKRKGVYPLSAKAMVE